MLQITVGFSIKAAKAYITIRLDSVLGIKLSSAGHCRAVKKFGPVISGSFLNESASVRGGGRRGVRAWPGFHPTVMTHS